MSVEDRTGKILKKLDELIDLVKKNQFGTVENHTHHHYPSYPTYTYPQYPYWTTSGGSNLSGNVSSISPGTTVSFTNQTGNGETTTP